MKRNWRSLMFVPANEPKRWAKAHTRGADCIIIDLEDSIQPADKAAARPMCAEAVRALVGNKATVAVRVNNHPDLLGDDLAAAVTPGLSAIVLPKAESAVDLVTVDEEVSRLEAAQAMPHGAVAVIAVIESPAAFERIREIADGPRLAGLCVGSEDFALSLGRPPTPMVLDPVCQQVAYVASARGLMGLGMACGIGNYTDLKTWENDARRAYAMGLTGALSIHPNQIPALHAAFGASEAELADARAIVAAWATRSGGVVAHNGRMLDLPIVERARRLLADSGEAPGKA
ncbi:MAG: CoA ester lyase [Alphaproteobacteria bacterium]|nr:CoA ester lyase [Alphaproteobacteria bacterium]